MVDADKPIISKEFQNTNLKNIEKIDDIINSINKINEVYFTYYNPDRNNLLKDQIMSGIKIIDDYLVNSHNLTKNEISFLYYSKTQLFDKLPEYNKIAEDSANKSLKMNPFLADSYNSLAHIIWKKGDLNQATNYFQQALEVDNKNKIALRNLSMIIRVKKSEDNEEKISKAKESLEFAKSAVDIDFKDSESWYIFGNAYFHYAFSTKEQYESLQKAVNCYNMSEKHQTSTFKNPDLFYNRAMVHLYLENYAFAYADLLIADSIDKNLEGGKKAEGIISNIILTCKMIKSQCNLKHKKLSQILSTIPTNLNINSGYELIACDYASNEVSNKKLISAKVIQIINKISDIPVSFICSDHLGNFFVLSIYNLSKEFQAKVTPCEAHVVILDPKITLFTFENQSKTYQYNKVSVIDLNKFLLNGKHCVYYSSFTESASTFFV